MPLLCDANTGWLRHQAMQVLPTLISIDESASHKVYVQVVNGVKDLDVYIEQPCLTYDECLSVRRHCPLPFVLDECMDDIGKKKSQIGKLPYELIESMCLVFKQEC